MSALEVAKGHIYTSIFIMSLCRKLLCNFFLKSHGGNVNEYSDHPSKRLEQEQCKRNPFTVQSHSHRSQARVQELQARPGFGLPGRALDWCFWPGPSYLWAGAFNRAGFVSGKTGSKSRPQKIGPCSALVELYGRESSLWSLLNVVTGVLFWQKKKAASD